jgi:hypothetical protein
MAMEEQLANAIRDFTEVAGVVPFDWEHKSPVPEAYQSQMRRADDKFYVLRFGFDTMAEALAAKARFDAINIVDVIITDEAEKPRADSRLKRIERKSIERQLMTMGMVAGQCTCATSQTFRKA